LIDVPTNSIHSFSWEDGIEKTTRPNHLSLLPQPFFSHVIKPSNTNFLTFFSFIESESQTTVTARVPVAVRLERRSQVVEESMQRNLVIPSALELERRDALQRRT
jgi:hypothetical protein